MQTFIRPSRWAEHGTQAALATNFTEQLSSWIHGSLLNKRQPRCAPLRLRPGSILHHKAPSMITLPTLSSPICIDYLCVLKQVSILYMCYIHAMHLISLNYSPEQFCVLIRGHAAVVYSNYDSYSFALLLNKQHQQSVILRPVNRTCTAIRADMAPELKKSMPPWLDRWQQIHSFNRVFRKRRGVWQISRTCLHTKEKSPRLCL